MHRYIFTQLSITAGDIHDDPDPGTLMQVVANFALCRHLSKLPHTDVLAKFGHQANARLIQSAAAFCFCCQQFIYAGFICSQLEYGFGGGVSKIDKVFITRDEISFAIYFNEDGCVITLSECYATFRGDSSGLFIGARLAALAQQILRYRNVAIGFHQRAFALHHAGAAKIP